MIKACNLVKRFDRLVAVDDVSFEVPTGETFGLLGPNGAGKTTTINMLVGLLKPDGGSVNINGVDDPTQRRVRGHIGNAPQSLAIYDELTAEENLFFFAKLYNIHGAELNRRVDFALDFTRLAERRKGRVSTFSGGMKRRLNLACALVHQPQVLLLDEPTVGVDPQTRNQIFESIEILKSEGKTIIYTTHYMEEAQRLCDRVAIIDNGKILDIDTVERLIEKHGGLSVIHGDLAQIPEDKSLLPGTIDGSRLRAESDRPMEQLAEMIESGLKFSRIAVERADLETVFLNLTGRRLRD